MLSISWFVHIFVRLCVCVCVFVCLFTFDVLFKLLFALTSQSRIRRLLAGFFWYCSYYPHRSRYALSAVCRIFGIGATNRIGWEMLCLPYAGFLPDPKGAGLHLAFQYSYVQTDRLVDWVSFNSLDQILVPTTWDLGNFGTWELGNLGT